MSSNLRVFIHFCFHTRNNDPWVSEDREGELISLIGRILLDNDAKLIRGGCCDNHIHLLVKIPARMSVEELVRRIKGASIHWVHRRWPELADAGWQHGYAGFSVDYRNLRPVYDYIKNQRQHHSGNQPPAGR